MLMAERGFSSLSRNNWILLSAAGSEPGPNSGLRSSDSGSRRRGPTPNSGNIRAAAAIKVHISPHTDPPNPPPPQGSSSQTEDEDFGGVGGGAWAAMKAEIGLDERNPSCFLHSYSVVMVLRKVTQSPKWRPFPALFIYRSGHFLQLPPRSYTDRATAGCLSVL